MFKGRITDVFFDLDHTLWDFERNSDLTFKKLFMETGLSVPVSQFLEIYRPINLEYWKQYRENRISKSELRYQRLRKSFDILEQEVSDETINELAVSYLEQLSTFSFLVPDTLEVLEYLKPRYRLHIITNGFSEVQQKKLRNSQIHGYFEQVIDSEMAGVKKPDPFIFKLALRRAGVQAQKALMIGDNMEADILGARAVGLHTLYFNVHNEATSGDGVTINHLREIKTYL